MWPSRKYLDYLNQYRQEDGTVNFPDSVKNDIEYTDHMRYIFDELDYRAGNNCFLPENWKMLEDTMNMEIDQNTPEDTLEHIEKFKIMCRDMYDDLMSNKELYFLNEYTLTRAGRKRIRDGLRGL